MARRLYFLVLGGFILGSAGAVYGQGLKGEYFLGRLFAGKPVLTRTENVNFNWLAASPDPAPNPVVPVDNFCVRWTGSITVPDSGNYIFSTRSDDGVRLMLAGDWIIDNWGDHSAAWNNSSPIALDAGKTYGIRLEFYENGGDAVIELYWTPPGSTQEIVPAAVLSTTYVPSRPAW
jgi:hypothetical protein